MDGSIGAAVLIHAANIIDTQGWTQYDMQDSEGRVCLVGAIRLASMDLSADRTEFNIMTLRIKAENLAFAQLHSESGDDDYGSLARYNDQPERTKEEVIAFLRNAAERAVNGE